jgi:pimeloyl-ACP methyl ester carboxylesterase
MNTITTRDGRSSQPWAGNDMNTYADDLATLVETLHLKNAIYVGNSTGAGGITRISADLLAFIQGERRCESR